jgi:fructose-1,6-bisphosphatase/inositol monophosphatase family enzyme
MKTANLNRIIKILEKSSNILLRDFIEIENLQNNYNIAAKFANASYQKIAEIIVNEFGQESNIELISGKIIAKNPESKKFYIICPIDGMVNFSRAISDFSCLISSGIINDDNQKEITESAMILPIFNQIIFTSKNSGIFCNNRLIKINNKNNSLIAIDNIKFANLVSNNDLRISGSLSVDIAHFVQGKIDQIISSDHNFKKILELYIKQSGAIIENKENYFIAKR